MTVQTITTPRGERLVVLTKQEYEDLIDIRDHARVMDAYRRGEGEWLTDAEMDQYLASPSPIAYWRKRRGLTQAALAEAVGITQPYLAQIETGRRTGDVMLYQRLATRLNLSIENLLPIEPTAAGETEAADQ